MSVTLAKQDTATIRNVLNYTSGRPYSEKRAYGRRVKFWLGNAPLNGNLTEATSRLKAAFGDRFIKCHMIPATFYGVEFEVQLKNWN